MVGANDDIAKSGTLLEDEDSVGLAALVLTVACSAATVVLEECQLEILLANMMGVSTLTHWASKVSPAPMY